MELSFRESLTRGLRVDNRPSGLAVPGATYYKYLRPTPFGARGPGTPTKSVTETTLTAAGISYAGIFPQLFRGTVDTILATRTALYSVSADYATLTLLTTYDLRNPRTTKSIESGNGWKFVDFHSTWMMFNGISTVFKSKWIDENKVFVDDATTINTGCAFKGRLLLGGFDSSNFWSDDWETLWGTWTSRAADFGMTLSAPGDNFIYWSPIGSATLMQLLLANYAVLDLQGIAEGFDIDDPSFIEGLRTMESGFMPMDWGGSVLNLMPFRDSVVVYGSEGVSAVKAYSDPAPTFGLIEKLLPIGLKSCTGVVTTDDKTRQVFVANDNSVWSLSSELQLEQLTGEGITNFLPFFATTDVTAHYDASRNEIYLTAAGLSGATIQTFLLNRNGFSWYPYSVRAITHSDALTPNDYLVPDAPKLTTGVLYFENLIPNKGRLATLQRVEVVYNTHDTHVVTTIAVQYKEAASDTLVTTSTFTLTNGEHVDVNLTGAQFELTVTLTPTATSYLDSATYGIDDIILHFREDGIMSLKHRLAN